MPRVSLSVAAVVSWGFGVSTHLSAFASYVFSEFPSHAHPMLAAERALLRPQAPIF